MGDCEIKGVTFNSRLRTLALQEPEKAAFVFCDEDLTRTVLTRWDVWDKSRRCAAILRRQGVGKGNVVCNTLVNSQERLITTYGVLLAGAVSMHGQSLLADGEDVIKNWQDSQCTAVIINPNEENGAGNILEKLKYNTDDDEEEEEEEGGGGKVGYTGLPALKHVIHVALGHDNTNDKHHSWLQQLEQEPETYVDDTVTEDDVAMVMTTSGSTGFAKLIPHTHKRLTIVASYLQTLIHLTQDSIYYNDRSLGWMGGAPITYPVIGLTRVLVDHTLGKPKGPGALMARILEQENCDTGFILPSAILETQAYLDSFGVGEKNKLSTLLRNIGTGGGPVPKSTMKSIGRICESMSVLYGASEFGNAFGLDVNADSESEYENCCCGYLADKQLAEFRILDENLQDVSGRTGECGEVVFRGPSLFEGYLNKPELNKDIFLPGGWWRTSDIGHVNEKGQLCVYCRKSFVINHKGFKHNPGWMEARLDKHPGIEKSIVVGIPDPAVFEEICLCITKTQEVPDLTPQEVHGHWRSLFVTSESDDITPIPKHYLFFDSFPLNNNGKVDRMAVKELARKRLEGGNTVF